MGKNLDHRHAMGFAVGKAGAGFATTSGAYSGYGTGPSRRRSHGNAEPGDAHRQGNDFETAGTKTKEIDPTQAEDSDGLIDYRRAIN